MNRTVRSVATSLAVGFALYFAARAVWWIVQPTAPLLMVLAIALYLLVVNLAILGSPETVKLPLWTATLAVIVSVIIPIAVTFSLNEAGRTAPFATWYIGGVGLLSVILIVRRRFLTGWLILLLLVATSSVFLGFLESLLNFGLVGSIMWVVVANLLVWFWDRAVRDTERLAEIQQAVSAWHATQLVRQRERRVRTQFALAVAGPVLSRAVATRGSLTEEERLDARLAEGRLRDELRGADLLNDAVRDAIEAARRRGAVVTVFDEGGLEGGRRGASHRDPGRARRRPGGGPRGTPHHPFRQGRSHSGDGGRACGVGIIARRRLRRRVARDPAQCRPRLNHRRWRFSSAPAGGGCRSRRGSENGRGAAISPAPRHAAQLPENQPRMIDHRLSTLGQRDRSNAKRLH